MNWHSVHLASVGVIVAQDDNREILESFEGKTYSASGTPHKATGDHIRCRFALKKLGAIRN